MSANEDSSSRKLCQMCFTIQIFNEILPYFFYHGMISSMVILWSGNIITVDVSLRMDLMGHINSYEIHILTNMISLGYSFWFRVMSHKTFYPAFYFRDLFPTQQITQIHWMAHTICRQENCHHCGRCRMKYYFLTSIYYCRAITSLKMLGRCVQKYFVDMIELYITAMNNSKASYLNHHVFCTFAWYECLTLTGLNQWTVCNLQENLNRVAKRSVWWLGEIALRWIDYMPILGQVMIWCRKTTSRYVNQF